MWFLLMYLAVLVTLLLLTFLNDELFSGLVAAWVLGGALVVLVVSVWQLDPAGAILALVVIVAIFMVKHHGYAL